MKPYFLQNEDGLVQVILDAQQGVFEFYGSIFALPDGSFVCQKIADYLQSELPETQQPVTFTFRVPWITEAILQRIKKFCIKLFINYTQATIRWYYHAERHTPAELYHKLNPIFRMPLELVPFTPEYLHPMYQAGTKDLPCVILDSEREIFKFSGRILPEDAQLFYFSIREWLEKYAQSPNPKTHFYFELEYFNSGVTDGVLLDIFIKLAHLPNGKVIWCYSQDDADMQEAGRELAEIAQVEYELRACAMA